MCYLYIGGAFVALYIFCYIFTERVPSISLKGKNLFITGGSSGIGLAVAKGAIKEGANVVIVARDAKKIDQAVAELKSVSSSSQVYGISCDVSSYASLEKAVEEGIKLVKGDFDVLVASAGMSKPSLFNDLTVQDFDRMFQINSLGCMYSVKAILPSIQRRGPGGRIMLVSSMAGLSGVAGYTAYSASKFALRGFAESLHMELLPQGIAVTLINPPDVDTPMYQEENKIKPAECKLISSGSGLFTAEQIAADILSAMKSWKFLVNTGMDGYLLALLGTGTSPAHSPLWAMLELFSLGIIRVVSLVYRWSYNQICISEYNKRQQNTTQKKQN